MDANLLGIGNLNANSPPHKRSLTLAMTFSFGLQPFIYLKHQGLGYFKRKDLLVIILFLLNVFLIISNSSLNLGNVTGKCQMSSKKKDN